MRGAVRTTPSPIKHGILFLKHIVHGEDGVLVESDIASRLHRVLIRFGTMRMPYN